MLCWSVHVETGSITTFVQQVCDRSADVYKGQLLYSGIIQGATFVVVSVCEHFPRNRPSYTSE